MNLDALIEAERNAPAMATPAERQKVWTSIERSAVAAPLFAPIAAGKVSILTKFGAALGTSVGKLALATAIVIGGTAGALSIPAPPSATAPTTTQSTASAVPKAEHPPKKAEPPPTTPRSPAPEQWADVPIQRPASLVQKSSKASPSGSRPTEAPSQPDGEPELEPKPVLDHGLRLVQQAERALKKNRPDIALVFLRRHRKLHPSNPLVERREALFVQALCEGNLSLAPKARWEFNRTWPKSQYRAHLREVCRRHSQ